MNARIQYLFALWMSLPLFALSAGGGRTCSCSRGSSIDFSSPASFRRFGLEVIEKEDRTKFIRRIYLRDLKSGKTKEIYGTTRGADYVLGHRGQLMLINDYFATKACKVVTCEVREGVCKEIDKSAIRMYKRNASPKPTLIIVPEAECLSPGDREVLIKMKLIYTSVSTLQQAEELDRTYKRWWYAVSSRTGRVLHEFRESCPPASWWSR